MHNAPHLVRAAPSDADTSSSDAFKHATQTTSLGHAKAVHTCMVFIGNIACSFSCALASTCNAKIHAICAHDMPHDCLSGQADYRMTVMSNTVLEL